MSEPPNILALPQTPVRVEPNVSTQQWGAELRDALRQLRTAPRAAHAGLRLHLRDRLEAARQTLLGQRSRLPAALRHYAVTLTEMQWLLDAWIAGSDTGSEDEEQLRHDFFHAASRLFDDEEPAAPLASPARPSWWTRWWRTLRQRAGSELQSEQDGPQRPA